MWPFRKKKSIPVDEGTIDRRIELIEQKGKVRRAEMLKARSAAVAHTLNEDSQVNHYVERLRLAYAEGNH